MSFNRRHPLDGWLWLMLILVSLVLIVLAFQGPVSARLAGEALPASPALVIHVWSFTGWMVLLAAQATFASHGRIRWHRAAGWLMLPLAAVMVWSGTIAQVEGDRLRMEERPELLSYTVVPISYLVIFAVLVVAAWLARRRHPAAHKRLVLLATGAIMSGVFIRALGPSLFPLLPPGTVTEVLINYGGTLLFMLAGISYDLVTRRSVHPVYVYAGPALILTMFAVLAVTKTQWIAPVTKALIG